MTNSLRATDPESAAFWAALDKAAENVPDYLKGFTAVGIEEYPRGVFSFVFAPRQKASSGRGASDE